MVLPDTLGIPHEHCLSILPIRSTGTIALCFCCAKSGTETRSFASVMLYDVHYQRRVRLLRSAMSGAEKNKICAAILAYGHFQVISLRACYAMSGTDIAYGVTSLQQASLVYCPGKGLRSSLALVLTDKSGTTRLSAHPHPPSVALSRASSDQRLFAEARDSISGSQRRSGPIK
eukprot:57689-Rhodomonas_salina.3